METTEQAIKRIITGILPGAEVLLFGSRARKDHREDSDWDLLVITEEEIEGEAYYDVTGKIHKALNPLLEWGSDIIIRSRKDVEMKKQWPGHFIRWAMKEGVLL
jgi:predicted nucleotidyltransferase